MKKKSFVFLCLVLISLFLVSAASAQLMLITDEYGAVLPVYTVPGAPSDSVYQLAAGSVVNIENVSQDGLWLQISANGLTGWISAQSVVPMTQPGGYSIQLLADSGLTRLGTGTVDYFGVINDMLPQLTVRRLSTLSAENAINNVQVMHAGGTIESIILSSRSSFSYTLRKEDVVFVWYTIPVTADSSLLVTLVYQEKAGSDAGAALRNVVNTITVYDGTPIVADTSVCCPNCGQWFPNLDEYQAHRCPGTAGQLVKCPDCGQWFMAGNEYLFHNCPARSDYVQCPDCKQWFEAGNVFRNHVCPAKNGEYSPNGSGQLIQCSDCGRWFMDGAEYVYHNCPARSEYVQCPDCMQWYEAGNVYRNHVCPARNNDGNDADESGKLIQCPDCKQWYVDGNDYLYHNCPARTELVQCPDCKQWFEAGNVFRNHDCPAKNNDNDDADESNKRIQCPDCKQWFLDGDDYLSHNCAAKSDMVQCPDCKQWFESGNVFRNHVCPAKNNDNDDADESNKRIQCPDCKQWFLDGDDYLNHNCAAKSDMVQCPDCKQWFESGNVFRNHVCPARNSDGDDADESSKKIQCPYCMQFFEDGDEYLYHYCPAKQSTYSGDSQYDDGQKYYDFDYDYSYDYSSDYSYDYSSYDYDYDSYD